jgi:hypothetical protein
MASSHSACIRRPLEQMTREGRTALRGTGKASAHERSGEPKEIPWIQWVFPKSRKKDDTHIPYPRENQPLAYRYHLKSFSKAKIRKHSKKLRPLLGCWGQILLIPVKPGVHGNARTTSSVHLKTSQNQSQQVQLQTHGPFFLHPVMLWSTKYTFRGLLYPWEFSFIVPN